MIPEHKSQAARLRCAPFVQRSLSRSQLRCQVMPSQPSVVPPTQDVSTTAVMPLTCDAVIRWSLRVLQLDDRGHAATRLPIEVTERILKMTRGQEHRDRMASVFAEMNALPKCQACGSVSKISCFSFFPPLVRRPFFSFQYKHYVCHNR